MTIPPHVLRAQDLSLAYGPADEPPVIEALDLAIARHEVTAIVGPNACGKSTLLRGLSRLLAPRRGAVLLDGQEIHRLPTRAVARRLALLPQHGEASAGLTVRELAGFGRHPHRGWLGAPTAEDDGIVARALSEVGLSALAEAPVDELSGGQRQRAWLALALAQQAEVLLLDEPTTFLDPAHQWEVLSLVRALNARRRCTVVMVMHDLNLAARFSDRIVMLRAGHLFAHGPPADVLTPAAIATVYGIRADVLLEPDGLPLIILRGLAPPTPDR